MGSTTAHFFLPFAADGAHEEMQRDMQRDGMHEDAQVDAYGVAPEDAEPEAVAAPRSSALFTLVERTLAGMGYELIDLERGGHGLLRVTLDLLAPADGAVQPERQVGIEDCERVSRHLTHLFAVEETNYERLEVSSPGIDRPLRSARDFARFAGEMAKVQLLTPEGRRRLRGRIEGLVSAEAVAGAPAAVLVPERVRMTLLPTVPPPVPVAKGRRPRPRKAVPGETVEFALAEVEKARLAPEWEFERSA